MKRRPFLRFWTSEHEFVQDIATVILLFVIIGMLLAL